VVDPADALPDWEKLLAAERHVQALVPGAVLVGVTAAAIHATYKGLTAPWNRWGHLRSRGRRWSRVIAGLAMEPRP